MTNSEYPQQSKDSLQTRPFLKRLENHVFLGPLKA